MRDFFGGSGLEYRSGPSFDYVQQPAGAGSVADRDEIDDRGAVLFAAAGLVPDVIVDPDGGDPFERGWVGSVLSTRVPPVESNNPSWTVRVEWLSYLAAAGVEDAVDAAADFMSDLAGVLAMKRGPTRPMITRESRWS